MKLNRFSMLAGALVAGSLALTACGGSSSSGTTDAAGSSGSSSGGAASLSGTLNGAGSTAQEAAHGRPGPPASRQTNPDVTVNYDPVGSGAGREQFLAGGVARSPAPTPPSTDERARQGQEAAAAAARRDRAAGLRQPDRRRLQPRRRRQACSSSPDTVAKIFAGKITKWNDPAIKADNPDAKLPGTAITPVHRSDDSGTTENFTDYLSKAAPARGPTAPARPGRSRAARPPRAPPASSRRSRPARAPSATPTTARPATSASATIKVGTAYVAPVGRGCRQGRRAVHADAGPRRRRHGDRRRPHHHRGRAPTRSSWSRT